jgi:hypothetical protein
MTRLANKPSQRKDTAEKMADAVLYLCRVAAAEGLKDVLSDLLELRRKLEYIASGEEESKTSAPRGGRDAH